MIFIINYSTHDLKILLSEEMDGKNLSSGYLVAKWQSILMLSSVCREAGCGALVLPSNIKVISEGTSNKIEKKISAIIHTQTC